MPPVGNVEGKVTHPEISACDIQPTSAQYEDTDTVFVQIPHHAVLAVSYTISRGSRYRPEYYEHFLLLAPLSTILATAERACEMSSCVDNVVEGGVDVAWHDWGPSGTRLCNISTPLCGQLGSPDRVLQCYVMRLAGTRRKSCSFSTYIPL